MTGLERKKERENDTANVMIKRVVVFREKKRRDGWMAKRKKKGG